MPLHLCPGLPDSRNQASCSCWSVHSRFALCNWWQVLANCACATSKMSCIAASRRWFSGRAFASSHYLTRLQAADFGNHCVYLMPCPAGHSDDERGHFRGSDVGRSDSGEVEMTEFDRPGMPRNSSASMLEEQAGTRAGDSSPANSVIECVAVPKLQHQFCVHVSSSSGHVVGLSIVAFPEQLYALLPNYNPYFENMHVSASPVGL